ncbi:MAG: hypothetical protein HW384_2190 [Dehalococcoidia bacterium]|nr:hypothetical protein [Dehalococcoidia bacterium]
MGNGGVANLVALSCYIHLPYILYTFGEVSVQQTKSLYLFSTQRLYNLLWMVSFSFLFCCRGNDNTARLIPKF